MIVRRLEDHVAYVVCDTVSLHAERDRTFGMAHKDRLHWVIEVRVERQVYATDALRRGPMQGETRARIVGVGHPGVGLIGGARDAVLDALRAEEVDRRIEAYREVLASWTARG